MRIASLVIMVMCLFGCVKMPTQTTQIVDDRPRVSFDVEALDKKLNLYQVRIDGIIFGTVDQFQRDQNTIPLLPGKHIVEVLLGTEVIFTKDVFLSENTTRVIQVGQYD